MPPTNITPGTAIEITALPYSINVPEVDQSPQDLTYTSTCDANSYHPLWWYFDVPAHINQISLIFTGDNSTYFPSLTLYTGIPPALTQWQIIDPIGGDNPFCGTKALNFFWVVPVTPSTRYWIRATDFFGTADAAASLSFSLISQPFVIAPGGSIMIRDDTEGFPTVLIGTDGAFLQTPPMVAGEFGAVLPTGEYCVDNNAQTSVFIYDSQLNLLDTHVIGVECIVSNESDFFVFVDESAGAHALQKILPDGSLSTFWPLDATSNGASGCAVDRAESIMYHHQGTLGLGSSPVKRYDLIGSAPLSNLVASIANEAISQKEMIILNDGTICIPYVNRSTLKDFKIRGYNTSGTLLFTYQPVPDTEKMNRWMYYPGAGTVDDPESIVLWIFQTFGSNSLSTFRRIRVSDGTVFSEITDIPGMAVSGNPLIAGAPWAVSNSCPLIVTRVPLNPPITPTTGSIIVQKVTVPNDNETEFNFQAEGGLSPSEFMLQHGESIIYDELDPGIYSILEEEVEGFVTLYEVSSGDDPSEINLEAGETITVIVTNYLTGQFNGIYKFQPGKRNDTIWLDIEENLTADVKIPNPRIRTALVGE